MPCYDARRVASGCPWCRSPRAGRDRTLDCGVIIEEPRYDTRAEQRPGTWVRRLETEIGHLRVAYDGMIVKASPVQRRRLPSIGSELSRLAAAAASMKDDLDWKRGRFGEHLAKAESVATSIDHQLSGAPVTPAVRSCWWDTTYALGFVREFYKTLGPQRLYEVQEDPRGVVTLEPAARRAMAPRLRSTRFELASLRDPVSALTRVNTGAQAAVAPAAERVRRQVERVRPLVQGHESEGAPGVAGRMGEAVQLGLGAGQALKPPPRATA